MRGCWSCHGKGVTSFSRYMQYLRREDQKQLTTSCQASISRRSFAGGVQDIAAMFSLLRKQRPVGGCVHLRGASHCCELMLRSEQWDLLAMATECL
eukprot:1148686-Pelagomonas_calceolata.AAC.2